MQIGWRNRPLESIHKTDPPAGDAHEMDSGFFRLPQLVMAGLAVSPTARGCFYIINANQAFRWQTEVLHDHQQFVGLPAKRAPRATAGSTVLKELNTLFEQRRTGMKYGRFGAVE